MNEEIIETVIKKLREDFPKWTFIAYRPGEE